MNELQGARIQMRVFCLIVFPVVLSALLSACSDRATYASPDEALQDGWRYYTLGEHQASIRAFEFAYETADRDSLLYAQAAYGLGVVWQLRRPNEDVLLASRYYDEVIALRPDHDLAAWSMLAQGRILHLVPVGETPDYDAVRAAYQRVIETFPNHIAGHEAFVYYHATYAATLEPEDAAQSLEALEAFLEQYPDSPFTSAVWSLKAVCYETLRMPEKRLHAEIKAFETAEIDPENPFQDHAWRYWTLATVAEFDAGDFDTARHYYRRLIEEYPTDIRIYASEQALERMDRTEARLRAAQQPETQP
jgi:tetratricopeptide (TPR) repeat protein